jgi:hypothetical protein
MKNILEQFAAPWVYDPNDREDLQVKTASGKRIADVTDNRDFTLQQCQTHAKVIAAAPEMLQALLSVQEYFFNDGSLFKYKDMLRMVDAAIRKVMDADEKPNNSTVID